MYILSSAEVSALGRWINLYPAFLKGPHITCALPHIGHNKADWFYLKQAVSPKTAVFRVFLCATAAKLIYYFWFNSDKDTKSLPSLLWLIDILT